MKGTTTTTSPLFGDIVTETPNPTPMTLRYSFFEREGLPLRPREYGQSQLVMLRDEPAGVFANGTMMFDIDGMNASQVHAVLGGSTETAWALFDTPNGCHVHCLSEWYYDYVPCQWGPEQWRGVYAKLATSLRATGLMLDEEYVAAALLTCRCWTRLTPKEGASFAMRYHSVVNVRKGGPITEEEEFADYMSPGFPIRVAGTLNVLRYAMDSLKAMAAALKKEREYDPFADDTETQRDSAHNPQLCDICGNDAVFSDLAKGGRQSYTFCLNCGTPTLAAGMHSCEHCGRPTRTRLQTSEVQNDGSTEDDCSQWVCSSSCYGMLL